MQKITRILIFFMEQIILSFKEKDEVSKVSTLTRVKEALKPLVDEKVIDIETSDKYCYTKEEYFANVLVKVRLENCGDKFLGSFLSWFAYKTSGVTEIEPGTYVLSDKSLKNGLDLLSKLTCMLHRINGIGGEGFEGDVYVKIENTDRPSVFNNYKVVEIEPLEKHAKYFKEFTKINIWDF